MPDKQCLSLRQRMTVFGFFRRGSVVDPCGRVDTRPYKALRFGTLAQPISILPQGDRKFSILHSQFSIQPLDGGQSLAALRLSLAPSP